MLHCTALYSKLLSFLEVAAFLWWLIAVLFFHCPSLMCAGSFLVFQSSSKIKTLNSTAHSRQNAPMISRQRAVTPASIFQVSKVL